MEVTGEGASVYAEAKGEYTRQLCQYLVPAIHKYFLEILDHAKELEPEAKKQLLQFQTLLEAISEWNVDKVQRETQRILISTQCDYIEELLTAVFIAHTKVLSAIRLTNKQKKLQITIPKLEHFLHRTLTECARHLWTNTFLFSSSYPPLERQKNMRQIEGLISEGVLQGVRTMLPVKSILREYLATEETESEYESDSDTESEDTDEEEEDAPSIVAPPVVLTPAPAEIPKPLPAEPPKPLPAEPHTLNLETKGVQFVEPVSQAKTESVSQAKTEPVSQAKTEPEELLFMDVNTDDIGFDDAEDVKTGLTGIKEAPVEEIGFEYEEI